MIGKFVPADNGSEIIASLLPHSFCWKEGEKVLVYDGEGRLFSFYQGNALYRRGLDSRVLRIHRKGEPGGSLKAHRYLSPKLSLLLFQHAFRETQHLRPRLTLENLGSDDHEVRDRVLEAVENVLTCSPGRLLNALVIAVHNIPEGIAISLPLRAQGVSVARCAYYSVLSSLPQPIGAVPSVIAVSIFQEMLPAGLGFAAGAMIYLVVAELLPESLEGAGCGPKETAGWVIAGTVIMLLLSVNH